MRTISNLAAMVFGTLFATTFHVEAAFFRTLPNLPDSGVENYGAWGVSADGNIAFGRAFNKDNQRVAVIWDEANKTSGEYPIEVDEIATGNVAFFPSELTDDGIDLYGVDFFQSPFHWSATSGTTTVTEGLGYVTGISEDKTVFVGASALGGRKALLWETGAGNAIELIDSQNDSYASDVSADGNIVVGTMEDDQGKRTAFAWRRLSGITTIITLDSELETWATALSADGSIAVGSMTTPKGMLGFRWELNWAEDKNHVATDAIQLIPNYVGPEQTWDGVEALAVSEDGSVIAGEDLTPFGRRAAYWTSNDNFAKSILLNDAFSWDVLDGLNFVEVGGISHDGNVIVGTAFKGAWMAYRYVVSAPFWASVTVTTGTTGSHVDTGAFMGWIDTSTTPYVFVYEWDTFLYAPDETVTDNGFWAYVTGGLGNVDDSLDPWIYLADVDLFCYIENYTGPNNEYWVWIPF